MRITTSIIINASIEKVFGVFSDLDQLAQRVGGITEVEVLEQPSQMAVGTKWKETRVMFGKEAAEVMWVTELTPNKRYVVKAESHGTQYRSEYTFEQSSDGVHVAVVFEGKPMTISAKILGVLFSSMTKSMTDLLQQDMVDLKKVCEENKN